MILGSEIKVYKNEFFELAIHLFATTLRINLRKRLRSTHITMSDWDSTTIIGRKARGGAGGGPRATVTKSAGAVNAARREGLVLSVDKKYTTGNARGDSEGQRLTKVDRETDIVKPKKLDPVVGRAISKARSDKKLSQKELATKINEKPTVINDYEAARAIPNQQVLAKLERALGVKLRGKEIGAPLGPKKK